MGQLRQFLIALGSCELLWLFNENAFNIEPDQMKKKISNWNNYPIIESNVRAFSFKEDLEGDLTFKNKVTPRGNARSYGDASLGKHTLITTKFDKILHFDASQGILACQSGITLDKVLEIIVPHGWFLPVTPGTKFITVGGAVSCDIHGKNHHVDGSFCRYVEELEIMLANNEIVLASKTNYCDLFEASCGGMGLTGIILTVKFRLKQIETSYMLQKQICTKNFDETLKSIDLYDEHNYTVAWVDCLKKGKHFGRGILTLGEHAKKKDLSESQKKRPLLLPRKRLINFPFYFPSSMLNVFAVAAFNSMYYLLHSRREKERIVTYDSFFYPLDAINHWNRAYGKRGFLQYQFVLPLESRAGLISILQLINKRKVASFLTVLKRLGPENGLMSFPMKGYTFALDFPMRMDIFDLLDELDGLVMRYGGRLYLAKDARMKKETLRTGYLEFSQFMQIVNKYNPERKISSMQAERIFFD